MRAGRYRPTHDGEAPRQEDRLQEVQDIRPTEIGEAGARERSVRTRSRGARACPRDRHPCSRFPAGEPGRQPDPGRAPPAARVRACSTHPVARSTASPAARHERQAPGTTSGARSGPDAVHPNRRRSGGRVASRSPRRSRVPRRIRSGGRFRAPSRARSPGSVRPARERAHPDVLAPSPGPARAPGHARLAA